MRLGLGVAFLMVGLSGCHCGSDAERAAGERAQIKRKVEGSFVLVPYRALKVVVRASGTAERAPEIEKLVARMPKAEDLPDKIQGVDDARKTAQVALGVAVLLYEARGELAKHDEDHYPLLWTSWTRQPLPASWYGNDAEHLALASVWTLGELIDQGGKTPSLEFAFYEIRRAEPKPDWPVPTQLLGRLGRGVAFCGADYHYAAEEELTAYVSLADRMTPVQEAALAVPGVPAPAELARAAGRFARAWNRLGLGRESLAVDDLEAGLSSMAKAGVENEATQWGGAFVHYYRGRFTEAAQDLEKLAQSPNLDEATKAELHAAAKSIKTQRPGIFGKARAGSFIAQALVARGGGAEKILARLVGEERAHQIAQPMAILDRLREGVAKYASADALTAKAREGGAKGLDLLKRKAGEVESAVGDSKPAP